MSDFVTTEFSCKRDGLTIRGMEYRPEGDCLPAVILSHGFVSTYERIAHYASFLAELGYVAYIFDFNGGNTENKSDGKTTEMSVLTQVCDLESVIDYVQGKEYVDCNRIYLWGNSFGGIVSAITAGKRNAQIKGLMLLCPALHLPDHMREIKKQIIESGVTELPDVMYQGPMALGKCFFDDILDMEPYELIKEYSGRVFLVHGDADTTVPISYSERAVAAYQESCPQDLPIEYRVDFYVFENAQHCFTQEQEAKIKTLMEIFLRNC